MKQGRLRATFYKSNREKFNIDIAIHIRKINNLKAFRILDFVVAKLRFSSIYCLQTIYRL